MKKQKYLLPLLLLAGVGAGAYWFFMKRKKDQNESDTKKEDQGEEYTEKTQKPIQRVAVEAGELIKQTAEEFAADRETAAEQENAAPINVTEGVKKISQGVANLLKKKKIKAPAVPGPKKKAPLIKFPGQMPVASPTKKQIKKTAKVEKKAAKKKKVSGLDSVFF